VSPLYTTNEALVAAILFFLLLAAAEAGFRLGRRQESTLSEKTKTQVAVIEGSVLAILGLLLAFTISMAVSRFETRKQLVLEEANTIGTSYLRTELVPEPDRSYIANRLREYVNLRVQYIRAGDDVRVLTDANALKRARQEAEHLQEDFWRRAVLQAQKEPNPVTVGLLLQSLNEVIDLDADRWTAFRDHVPWTVVHMDALAALLAAVLVGYALGLARQRNLISVALLSLAVTLSLIVIVDLDRSRQGLITVTQQPILTCNNDYQVSDRAQTSL